MLIIKIPVRKFWSERAEDKARCAFNLVGCLFLSALLITSGCMPAGPEALLQGEKLIAKGRYALAIEKLRLATTLIPTNAQAWNYLGLAHHYARQADEAEKTYRRALLINHDLSEAHYNLGCLYLEQKKNELAKTELLAYTLRRANSLDALLKLGTAQLRVNELTAAEKTFQDALKLNPQNSEALNGLGCIRARQRGRASEAAGYFRAALKSQTNYAPALLNWAIMAQQQDKRFALQKYREYLSVKPAPENFQAVNVVALQLQHELNPPVAVPSNPPIQSSANLAAPKAVPSNINQSASQKSDSSANLTPKAASNLPAKATTNTLKPSPAIAQPLPSNTNVVKLSPEPFARPGRDILADRPATGPVHEPAEAASGLSASRLQAEKLFAEGRRAQQVHRLPDAINSYRAASQQDPTYFDAFYNLALALTETGNFSDSVSAYERALAIRPDSLDARYNLALVVKQNGDFTRAAAEFEELLQKHPDDARSHLALGNLYAQQLHEPAKARQHYLKVLETDPRNPQASAIRFWLTSNP